MNLIDGKKTIKYLVIGTTFIAGFAVLAWLEKGVNSAETVSLITQYSHAPGEYDEDIYLEITSPHPDAEIYFTLDGSIPDPAIPAQAGAQGLSVAGMGSKILDSGPCVNGSHKWPLSIQFIARKEALLLPSRLSCTPHCQTP